MTLEVIDSRARLTFPSCLHELQCLSVLTREGLVLLYLCLHSYSVPPVNFTSRQDIPGWLYFIHSYSTNAPRVPVNWDGPAPTLKSPNLPSRDRREMRT